jgi:RarD protein
MDSKNKKTTYAQFIISMVIVGTIGIFRRNIALSSAALAFSRGLLGSFSLGAFVKVRGKKIFHKMEKRKLLLLILNGAIIGVNWIFLFEAYRFTTVAVATLCYYLQPTLLILASPVFFGEKLTVRKMIFAFTAFLGMVLVSGVLTGGDAGSLRGVAFGLAAAVLYTAAVIINKKTAGVDPYEKTIIQLASAAIVLIPYIAATEDITAIKLDAATLVLVLIVGVIHTGLVYFFYFGSMERMEAQAVAVLSYIDPVVAVFASWIFLSEPLTPAVIIGAVLIIGSAVMSERNSAG